METWSCSDCNLVLNVRKIVYPIRCKCGFFDKGKTYKKRIETPLSPWEQEYRANFPKGLCPLTLKSPITLRHCLYHIYAPEGDTDWLDNVKQLRRNSQIFNGIKYAAIAHDNNTIPNKEIKKQLPGFQFIEMKNDPILRETITFLPLLKKVIKYNQPGNAVFYAHTKGNTTLPVTNTEGARLWRNIMYDRLLDKYRQCMIYLRKYYAVGIHKTTWPESMRDTFPSGLEFGNRWMFAGTFFWFRADALFSANWKILARDRYGVEAWLSGSLKLHEGKSVYQVYDEMYPFCQYDPRLYDLKHGERFNRSGVNANLNNGYCWSYGEPLS
jgi:hypothetical protein